MKQLRLPKFIGVLAVLVLARAAIGQVIVPDFPSWWPEPGAPPDGVTRAGYYHFSTHPDQVLPPDWVYNGIVSEVPDTWIGLEDATFGDVIDPDGCPFVNSSGALGDGIGVTLADRAALTVRFGNGILHPKKDYMLVVIYKGGGAATATCTVPLGYTPTITSAVDFPGLNGWHAAVVEGSIRRQPPWEEFTITFFGPNVQVDSLILVTHCYRHPADVNGDGVVDVLDLLAVIAAWGNPGGLEDINNDGIVDILDVLFLISAWGPY